MLWLLLSLLCIAVVLISIKLSKIHNHWTKMGVKQRKQIYLLGDQAAVTFKKQSLLDMFLDLYNAFPNERYIGFYQATLPTLMIKDLELLKLIMVKNFDHFLNHRQLSSDDDPIWTKNLFFLKDKEWKKMRTTVSPILTSSKMKIIFNLVSECADTYMKFLSENQDTTIIELKDFFTRYTNDVIASVAFGLKCNSLKEKDNEFYINGQDLTKVTFSRMLGLFANMISPKFCKITGIKVFPDYLTKFFKNIITDSIKLREERGVIRPDLIHLLLEARKGQIKHDDDVSTVGFAAVNDTTVTSNQINQTTEITDTDIAAQATIFFFAGFETVSTALTFLGYELTINPDIQKNLQVEIDDVMKACNGQVTYDAVVNMKYMDMVVSEILRKWPPGVGTDRVCTKAFTIEPKNPGEKPVTLQPGDTLWIPTIGLHRDPIYYPNPDKFDPERFSDENKDKIVPYTYIPFGGGPRHCVASRFAVMELKAVAFHMLYNFDFVVTEKTDIPLKIAKGYVQMGSENGMWIGLKPREK